VAEFVVAPLCIARSDAELRTGDTEVEHLRTSVTRASGAWIALASAEAIVRLGDVGPNV
jgi:hypothetical protein